MCLIIIYSFDAPNMSVLISGNGLGQVLVLASCVVSVGLRGVVQYEIEMWLKDKAIK